MFLKFYKIIHNKNKKLKNLIINYKFKIFKIWIFEAKMFNKIIFHNKMILNSNNLKYKIKIKN